MPIGKGMMGGPGGTYGKYNVGVNSNLSSQFIRTEYAEEEQRKRFDRKREPGFSGSGFWFANYPYMVGALGAGTDQRLVDTNNRHEMSDDASAASDTSGMGSAGTATSFGGM